MKKQNHAIAILASLGMLVLILDGKTALQGAADGIDLCTRVLIPSLFPFFVLSTLLTTSLSGQAIPFLKPIGYLCKIPEGTESVLAIGLLGGYPVGAQNVTLLYQKGQLSASDAERMLAFCNNAGPAFIFGILSTMFSHKYACFLLWIVHIVSALLVALLLTGERNPGKVIPFPVKPRVTDALWQSVKAMAQVCGWVILMRIILVIVENWFLWILPVPARVILAGVLELSNGCIRLSDLNCEGLRFIIASGLLSFGGICVTLQTVSVADKLSLRRYFPGKLLQCCISVILSYFLQLCFPAPLREHGNSIPIMLAVTVIFILCALKYRKKSSSIPAIVGV